MLKRLSVLGRKKTDKEANSLANGDGGHANGAAEGTPNGLANGHEANGTSKPTQSKRMSFARTKKQQSSADTEQADRSVTRGDIDNSFQQFEQLVHASARPLPTQTGDGSYLEHEAPSSLFQELRSLGFKDFNTLREVISSKASGALVDDKTMIMERVIQVGCHSWTPGDRSKWQ